MEKVKTKMATKSTAKKTVTRRKDRKNIDKSNSLDI